MQGPIISWKKNACVSSVASSDMSGGFLQDSPIDLPIRSLLWIFSAAPLGIRAKHLLKLFNVILLGFFSLLLPFF